MLPSFTRQMSWHAPSFQYMKTVYIKYLWIVHKQYYVDGGVSNCRPPRPAKSQLPTTVLPLIRISLRARLSLRRLKISSLDGLWTIQS